LEDIFWSLICGQMLKFNAFNFRIVRESNIFVIGLLEHTLDVWFYAWVVFVESPTLIVIWCGKCVYKDWEHLIIWFRFGSVIICYWFHCKPQNKMQAKCNCHPLNVLLHLQNCCASSLVLLDFWAGVQMYTITLNMIYLIFYNCIVDFYVEKLM
jgi:hypothetical protein